jgi:flavorubredoxin
MKPTEIADGVYEIGVIDWNIRDFHGYSTDMGTSYNAYLVIDEKVALIDTVKAPFTDPFIGNISRIIDPQKIDVVISNHTEMDHSGALPAIMRLVGQEKPLYCSKMGAKNLSAHFTDPWNYHAVAEGETLSLGKRTLTFMETRMIHWPDSMFTYLNEDRILFSSDAFGQHFASFDKFDDQVGADLMVQAKKYYANILLLYAPRILKLVEKIKASGISIDMICPDHGIIWRRDPDKIIDAYLRWSRQELQKKVVVVYDTMWKSTETMANAICEGISSTGVKAKPIHIRSSHRSDIMTDVLDAAAVVVGSPTLNNQMFPTVADVLTYMKGLKPMNRIGGVFGSYGWSGEAVKLVTAELTAMNFKMIEPGPRVLYVPNSSAIEAGIEYGKRIGDAVNAE